MGQTNRKLGSKYFSKKDILTIHNAKKKLTKQLKQKQDSRINQSNTGFAAAFPKNVLLVQ